MVYARPALHKLLDKVRPIRVVGRGKALDRRSDCVCHVPQAIRDFKASSRRSEDVSDMALVLMAMVVLHDSEHPECSDTVNVRFTSVLQQAQVFDTCETVRMTYLFAERASGVPFAPLRRCCERFRGRHVDAVFDRALGARVHFQRGALMLSSLVIRNASLL